MISHEIYDIMYDVIGCAYDMKLNIIKTLFFCLSCAIFMEFWAFWPWYHIHIIRNRHRYPNYMILRMILAMIWPSDISIPWYHRHVISQIWWCLSLYHGTCAAGWRWLGEPGARRSTSSGLSIANVLGTCVQLTALI